MTFDPTKPCETRDGRPARILCTDKKGSYPIVALVPFKNEILAEHILSYNTEGMWCADNRALDLVNVVERTSRWRNLWEFHGNCYDYDTKEKALSHVAERNNRLGLIELHYEDGVFVGATFHKVSE